MPVVWNAAPGSHAVQFYEGDEFLHRALVAFCAEALERGEPLVLIARRRTFEAVAQRLASERACAPADLASRVRFVDADAALGEVMDGDMPDPVRFDRMLSSLLSEVGRDGEDGPAWIYGEMVDVLCRQGRGDAAVCLEGLWNAHPARPHITVLCGYAIDSVEDLPGATQLRDICQVHSHVIPGEGFSEAPDDRTRFEEVVRLQQRARVVERARAHEPALPVAAVTTSTVYVIDDDASVRRSLARLLKSVDVRVQDFESAEAFLDAVDETSSGCLLVDVQLVGMTGPDLQRRLSAAGWSMPVIAMSGSHDEQIEREALRLGAHTFLRKPFDADVLIGAIARAMS